MRSSQNRSETNVKKKERKEEKEEEKVFIQSPHILEQARDRSIQDKHSLLE